MWEKYVAKEDTLLCRLRATDHGARDLMLDTRSPPSAQSIYVGSFEGCLVYPDGRPLHLNNATDELQRSDWVDLPIANPEMLYDFEDRLSRHSI